MCLCLIILPKAVFILYLLTFTAIRVFEDIWNQTTQKASVCGGGSGTGGGEGYANKQFLYICVFCFCPLKAR